MQLPKSIVLHKAALAYRNYTEEKLRKVISFEALRTGPPCVSMLLRVTNRPHLFEILDESRSISGE